MASVSCPKCTASVFSLLVSSLSLPVVSHPSAQAVDRLGSRSSPGGRLREFSPWRPPEMF